MTLLQFLKQHYCTSGDDCSFRVDDRTSADKSPSFCDLITRMNRPKAKAFDLILKNVPWDEHVEAIANAAGGKWTGDWSARTLTLPLTVRSITTIRKLAEAIRKVTGRGRRYPIPNWKWVTRRTADSLQLFADRLKEYRHMSRIPVVTGWMC